MTCLLGWILSFLQHFLQWQMYLLEQCARKYGNGFQHTALSCDAIALAYEMLLLEGYIESQVGDGTRVVHLQPERSL
jgi:hypothetical protein